MAVKIRFPDAHPETDSVDGGAAAVYTPGQPVVGATWDTAHDSPGTEATVSDSNSIGDTMIRAYSVTDKYDIWRRQIVVFNNPGLSAGDTITAVTVQWANVSVDNDFGGSVTLDTAAPASNTEIVAGDYNSFGGVKQTDTDLVLGSMSTGLNNLNTITLNATGRGNTPKGAVSKWMWRIVSDFDDSPVTWASGEQDQSRMYTADEAESGDQRPRINITYTPAPFTPRAIMF